MMNKTSKHGVYFGFYWQTGEAERAEVYAKADALIDAAISGGMKKQDAVTMVQKIFSAGWTAGESEGSFIDD